MKERPILFNGAMVRAILDGSKTQTRRVCKLQPHESAEMTWWPDGKGTDTGTSGGAPGCYLRLCPFGQVGDRIYVRETWQAWHKTSYEYDEWEPISVKEATTSKSSTFDFGPTCDAIEYRATSKSGGPWTPSIHMPRWASRILLEITDLRVERLQNITEQDAKSEGCAGGHGAIPDYGYNASQYEHFMHVWESVYGNASWIENPWVWVIEFKRV